MRPNLHLREGFVLEPQNLRHDIGRGRPPYVGWQRVEHLPTGLRVERSYGSDVSPHQVRRELEDELLRLLVATIGDG